MPVAPINDQRSFQISEVTDWVTDLIERRPRKPVHQLGAERWRLMARHWIRVWQNSTKEPLPLKMETIERFVSTMHAEGDLSQEQINHLCQVILAPSAESLDLWLADTIERFMWRIRPWIPLWTSFADWSVNWCMHRRRKQLVFLARDMLSTYLTARKLEGSSMNGLDLRVVHACRNTQGAPREVFGLPDPDDVTAESVALVDSGCYGTVIGQLAEELTEDDAESEKPACIFYFSRNPKIFGFINYLVGPAILEEDIIGHDVADFVIYAGDLLESLPKPYHIVRQHDDFVARTQDLLTFCLSMATLSEIRDYVDAGPMISIPQAQRRAHELYDTYINAQDNPVLDDSLLFGTPAPKCLPASYGFNDVGYESYAPQDEIFGPVPG
ncbi:MAG TPA: hypothetical protein VFB06_21980 [Streptosporangiaceae bacterium]|nr:hypothetical protein [Streptosporangiaceae bacterium]